ncbi:TolC family outer membrane protein [Oceanisphaera sp.]|uniref:TolC family outer membrane protein n=1 Tax=Oceanisphaera sp. TaxID=1929979 RepID=UPI003A926F5C
MTIKIPLAKLIISASLLIIPAASLSATQQDNLLTVVQETLATNPELQVYLDAFNASLHDERQAFGGFLPSVDLNLSAGQAQREFDNRGNYSRNYAEVSLTQMLFDGFRVRSALAKAEHTSLVRYYELLNEAETKALEASEAYVGVLRYRELVKLAQKNEANHQRVYEQLSQRVSQGVSNKADLQQINGRLSLARSNLLTEVANLQTVTARFQRLVGRLPAEQLAELDIPKQMVPSDLAAILNRVYRNNPALYSAAENTQAAAASYRETQSNRYPTLELGARHGTYSNNNSFDNRTDPGGYGDESIVELRARYNLYSGGSDKAAEYAAYTRIEQAESQHNKTCVDLRQTATVAHSDMLNLEKKRALLASHRDAAASVVVAYRQQFNISRRSLLDVLDSENEAFQSERAYLDGHYDLQLARLRTLHTMGNLLDALSVSSEKIPTLSDLNGSASPGNSHFCTVTQRAELSDERSPVANMPRVVKMPPIVEVHQAVEMQPVAKAETLNLSTDALFDTDSTNIKPEFLGKIRQFVQPETEKGTLQTISVMGHTDNVGANRYNWSLSLARAKAVFDALINSGINPAILTVSGAGPERPIATNDTEQGRALNRRVEITVTRTPHHVIPQPETQAVAPHSLVQDATPRPVMKEVAPRPVAQAEAPRSEAKQVAPRPAAQAVVPQSVVKEATPRTVANTEAPSPVLQTVSLRTAPEPVAVTSEPQPVAPQALAKANAEAEVLFVIDFKGSHADN